MRIVFLCGLALLVLLFGVSCTSGSRVTPPTATTGAVKLTVKWPARDRMIPVSANSVGFKITRGGDTLGYTYVTRQEGASAVSTTLVVPIGEAVATVSAFPTTDATGVAQSTGSTGITVLPRQTNNFSIQMQSTVQSLVVTPPEPYVDSGATRQLNVIGTNGTDFVLLSPAAISWSKDASTAITMNATGLVTGSSPGSSVVTVTDTELGKSTTATVVCGSQTFNLPRQYSSTQGQNGWYYYMGVPANPISLSWGNVIDPVNEMGQVYSWNAYGTTPYLQVTGRNFSANRWWEPGDNGIITLGSNNDVVIGIKTGINTTYSLRATLNATGVSDALPTATDDGAYLSIYKNTTMITSEVHVFHGQETGGCVRNGTVTANTNLGGSQYFYFVIRRGNDNVNDSFYYSFTLCAAPWSDIDAPTSSVVESTPGLYTVTASDNGGSGVAGIDVAVTHNGYSDPMNGRWRPYAGPFSLDSGDIVMYRAIDNIGNLEQFHSYTAP